MTTNKYRSKILQMSVDSEKILTNIIGDDSMLPYLAKKDKCETTNIDCDNVTNYSTPKKNGKIPAGSQKPAKQESCKKRSWTRSEDNA